MDTSQIAIYSDTAGIECDYDRVAMINAEGSMSSISDEKMINNAKVDAGKSGANALIIGGMQTDDADYNPYAFGGSDYGSRQGRFLAVREYRPCGTEGAQ